MQIARHWRLNSQRYRLQGVRYENGAVSLQPRPNPPSQKNSDEMGNKGENADISEKVQLKGAKTE